jgi:N-methylhydantoinase B
MDASCAVFDSLGRLIAQAEHIPVHLGSMPLAVSSIRECFGEDLKQGDQIIVNDPYHGGSHLNDITLVKPVFREEGIVGYAVCKAHHSDVGGKTPGSMPHDSRTLEEEGLVIEPMKLLMGGKEDNHVFDMIRSGTRHPVERMGDLRAQISANNTGERRLLSYIDKYGLDGFTNFVEAVLDYSEKRVRRAITSIPNGTYEAEDIMDGDGISQEPVCIRATVRVGQEDLAFDFTGTHRQVEGNINAPVSVALSSVYYTVRCVTDFLAPPNQGCLRPIEVHIPEGSLLNPRRPAAVSAGNVETSQRIVDVLFLALARALPDRIPAQSQGTMNNLLIGCREFTYYETVAGGEGALPSRHGQGGIHTHMTNTANTPVEALEMAYPLRVESYELLVGTGGSGRFHGGDGVRRAVRFLGEKGTVSIISDRRNHPPMGLSGGGNGTSGKNYIIRESGIINLPSKVSMCIERNDLVVVETPGGGGWGHPEQL